MSLRIVSIAALAASLAGAAGCGSSESCSITHHADGTATIKCSGDEVQVGGSSCSVTDNGDGTSTITCADGTTVTVSSDGDASCTIKSNPDGSRTVTCSDGTEALIPAPGCTTSQYETPTYVFLLHHCPDKETAAFGFRRAPVEPSPQLAVGGFFACGLRSNGHSYCWGGLPESSRETFVHVAAGMSVVCGLTSAGKAICYGGNQYGVAGAPEGEIFSQLTLGRNYACGLRRDGSVACWGNGGLPIYVPSGEEFVHIAGRNSYDEDASMVCGLRADGSVRCWYLNGQGLKQNEVPVPADSRFVQIARGAYHHCGVRLDGTGVCWGWRPRPDEVPPGTFVQIDGGYDHACGLRADGSVTCWGSSSSEILTPPTGEVFVAIDADEAVTCGLRANETAVCWGPGLNGNSMPTFPFACRGPQDAPSSTTPGVFYERWNNRAVTVLPDFSMLGAPSSTGTVTNFSVPGGGDYFVVRETAWVQLPTSGDYWFKLTSDEGSRLLVDGYETVDHDGLHDPTSKIDGPYCLEAGWHKLVVEYFEATDGEVLQLEVSTDGTSFAPIPDAALFH